jgi:hypothetical protein
VKTEAFSRGTFAIRLRLALALLGTLAIGVSSAFAQASSGERIYFSAVDNVRAEIVRHIRAEKVRVDMSAWYLTDGEVVNALLAKHAEGVPIRLIGDRGSIFEIDIHSKNAF